MKILIAEDNIPLASLIAKTLSADYETVEMVHDGQHAVEMVAGNSFDVLVLDLGLPTLTGVQVLSKIRTFNKDVAILILTSVDEVEERVACLDAGADDYLTKPVALSEVSARVRALLRRSARPATSVIKVADLELDLLQRKVHRGNRAIELTAKEFNLLEYFMRNAGRDITRKMIIEDVWSMSGDTVTNVVDVYVNYLRKKIDEAAVVKLINTVRGIGFRFGPPQNDSESPAAGSDS